jgi:multidrug resistance efflux pump
MIHHLSLHHVVPPLRDDLAPLPEPTGTGAEMVSVAPVEGAGAMRMHGFELSIARMLDGHRTAEEVIANCQRLGLPVNIDSLEDFVHQLATHGLLGSRPVPKEALSWSPAIRELYRDALKAAREGDFDRAHGYLDAMRELAPDAPEAKHLTNWLDTHPDPLIAGSEFGEIFQRTLDSWSADRPPHWAAEVRDSVRRTWWPVLGLLTAIGFLVAYALLPNTLWVREVAQLEPASVVAIASPAALPIDHVLVQEGQRVELGAPLFSYGANGQRQRLDGLQRRLEEVRAPLRQQVAQTTEGAPLAKALERADRERKSAEAQVAALREEGPAAAGGERQQRAEQRLVQATNGQRTAREQLDARIPPDAPGASTVSKLAEQVKELEDRLAAQTVRAPAPGVVKNLDPEAPEGQPVLTLVDASRLKLTAKVQPRYADRLFPGMPITVRIGHDRVRTTVEATPPGAITADVENPDGALAPGPLAVEVQLPPPERGR